MALTREAAASVQASGHQLRKKKQQKGLGHTTPSSSALLPLYLPVPTLQPSQSQRGAKALAFWPGQSLVFSPKRARLTSHCFPKTFLLPWGLSRPLGSRAPCDFPSSPSACSKASSWGLLSKGHISYALSPQPATPNFVPSVVCGWRGHGGIWQSTYRDRLSMEKLLIIAELLSAVETHPRLFPFYR